MCGCSKDLNPLMVDGRVLYYNNYQTFNYEEEVTLVLLKKNVVQPISTRTIWNNKIELSGVTQYALVSLQESIDLLKFGKRGRLYFVKIENYIIESGIVEET